MKKSLNIQNLTIVTLIIIIIVLGASNFAALRKLDLLTRDSETKNQERAHHAQPAGNRRTQCDTFAIQAVVPPLRAPQGRSRPSPG